MEYYTYAYLRENKTPYYIGKGKKDRAFKKRRGINALKDKSNILILKKNLTEEEAFKHEIYMIYVFGRKDLGTGILLNRTNGGEGVSGIIPWNIGKKHSYETKQKIKIKRRLQIITNESKIKMSKSRKGKSLSCEHKIKIGISNKGKNKGKKLSENHKNKISQSLFDRSTKHLYNIIYPDGRSEITDNIQKFCRNNSNLKLDNSALLKVAKGIYSSHKGFNVVFIGNNE
jgi:hypothetical protein